MMLLAVLSVIQTFPAPSMAIPNGLMKPHNGQFEVEYVCDVEGLLGINFVILAWDEFANQMLLEESTASMVGL